MLQLAVDAALEAGRFLKMNIGKIKHIEHKQGEERNLVTEIDKKTEHMIIEKIKQRYPQHDFLAEESGSHHSVSDYKWIIDPLDGTTNYTHGLPVFCTSIALEHQGQVVLGAIYDPNQDELFTAEKGKGAYLNNRRIHVSSAARLMESLIVTGFPYDIKDNPYNAVGHFANFLMSSQAVRRLGSAALDLSYVACGRFDGFWEVTLNPWDMAAGVLFVEEAGGKFTNFRGFPSDIYSPNVLTTNGLIHDQMVDILKKGL
ncbi:MAG TPA: inositol monophosphatase family protein [Bacteroidota bacterium]|nr:inositol monophosphatase family protein [Bacteroidota bacterium]